MLPCVQGSVTECRPPRKKGDARPGTRAEADPEREEPDPDQHFVGRPVFSRALVAGVATETAS